MLNQIVRSNHDPADLVNLALLDTIAAEEQAGHKTPGRYCIMQDLGAAMLPKFGGDDPLLIDRSVRCYQGDAIYVFSINGQVFIRALQRVFTGSGKGLKAIAYNDCYDSFEFEEGSAFEIFGQVVQYWHGTRC